MHAKTLTAIIALCGACSSSNEATVRPATDTGAATDSTAPIDSMSPMLTYPAGPYGVAVGETFPNATWDGLRPGSDAVVKISMLDYYDPTGARGIHGVYLSVTSTCGGICSDWTRAISRMYREPPKSYAARGARILELLSGSYVPPGGEDPKMSDLVSWRDKFATGLDLAIALYGPASPGGRLLAAPLETVSSYPTGWVIDPRTMKVTSFVRGSPSDPSTATTITGLDPLLDANGGGAPDGG